MADDEGRVEVRDGDYEDLAGASLVMLAVGINEQTGGATDREDQSGRLRLLDKNAEIFRDVVPRVVEAAPDAVLMVVTDPARSAHRHRPRSGRPACNTVPRSCAMPWRARPAESAARAATS